MGNNKQVKESKRKSKKLIYDNYYIFIQCAIIIQMDRNKIKIKANTKTINELDI